MEVLRVQGARILLLINTKKTKPLRLGISECIEVMLGNKKIDHVDKFTYLVSSISKDSAFNKDVISRITRIQGIFS